MSHDDETTRAPAVRSVGLDDERLPEVRSAADPDSELAELRRNLLIYGTAGQAARNATEVRAS